MEKIRKPLHKDGSISQMLVIALPMVVSQACDTAMIFTGRLFLAKLQPELMNAAMGGGLTVFMITHDVDEAILLADKVILMSNGPLAKIAETVEVTMPRDRTRAQIHHNPQFYQIRNHLVDFLVNRSKDYAGSEAALLHDAKHPPVVRPGLDDASPASRYKKVVNL